MNYVIRVGGWPEKDTDDEDGGVWEGRRKSGIICEQPFISNKNNPRKKVDALLLPLSLKNIAHTQPLIPSPIGMGIYVIPSHSFNYQKESHDCN